MKKSKKHGFSLIELLCIILIVGLLLTMCILAVFKMIDDSKKSSRLAQVELINKACESYI